MNLGWMFVAMAVLACASTIYGQADVDYISKHLDIKFEVISNFDGGTSYFTSKITLTNSGTQAIAKSGWNLYFMSIYMVEPDEEWWKASSTGYEIPNSGFRVYHVAGCLFRFQPTSNFNGILARGTSTINLKIQNWNAARTNNMPNWYVVDVNSNVTRTILSTATEQLETFTGDYDTRQQWKRYQNDKYDPWTLQERFNLNEVEDFGSSRYVVLPTPYKVSLDKTKSKIQKPMSGWKIVTSGGDLNSEAQLLSEKLNLQLANETPVKKYVKLEIGGNTANGEESYVIVIDGSSDVINITSPTPAGIFYGCQSLISIYETDDSPEIESMTIEDHPRFGYRGMHVDVARHFVSYEDIIKLIEAMGMYKLNKLHFHLTDDEGWRIEMPWCPFLTTVGATQCHDPDEMKCIYPQFGSNSNGSGSGSGYYTAEQYRNILRAAKKRHIEVIPEVNMPGHARAAIKAVEAFLKINQSSLARSIQLSEPGDPSSYFSVQMYKDNTINPCLNSTYEFIRKTISTFIDYHKDIQPLKIMHLGGDEVAEGVWKNSSACAKEISNCGDRFSVHDLAEVFVSKISEVARELDSNLTIGLWEDGAITKAQVPFNLSGVATDEVVVNSWQNTWEWGAASRAYKLANAGYKVVMSQATHLYFDHPDEPDPEERGFYWATRYTSCRKTFGFKPDDLYANVDTTTAGDPLSREELCKTFVCTPLEKRENIIGMQGQIWTETVRNSRQFFRAVFPRLLALAERAWHKAPWETSSTRDETAKNNDWENFANTLGYKELPRLEKMGVSYRVPVPGVKVENGIAKANSEFPGLPIHYASSNKPGKWKTYVRPVLHTEPTYFQIRTADDTRGGRVVTTSYNSTQTTPSLKTTTTPSTTQHGTTIKANLPITLLSFLVTWFACMCFK